MESPGREPASPPSHSPALNLSYKSDTDEKDEVTDKSESELADIDDDTDNISDTSLELHRDKRGKGSALHSRLNFTELCRPCNGREWSIG